MKDDNNFFAGFNCASLKNDIIIFSDRLAKHFYQCCYVIFITCVLSGITAYVGIYSLLLSMQWFPDDAKWKKEKSQRDETKKKKHQDEGYLKRTEFKFVPQNSSTDPGNS